MEYFYITTQDAKSLTQKLTEMGEVDGNALRPLCRKTCIKMHQNNKEFNDCALKRGQKSTEKKGRVILFNDSTVPVHKLLAYGSTAGGYIDHDF